MHQFLNLILKIVILSSAANFVLYWTNSPGLLLGSSFLILSWCLFSNYFSAQKTKVVDASSCALFIRKKWYIWRQLQFSVFNLRFFDRNYFHPKLEGCLSYIFSRFVSQTSDLNLSMCCSDALITLLLVQI